MKRFTSPSAIFSILSSLFALAAGIFFYTVDGKFGIGKVANYWDPLVFGLLIASIIGTNIAMGASQAINIFLKTETYKIVENGDSDGSAGRNA